MARQIAPSDPLREAVGVFADPLAIERAVQELLTTGFDRGDVSVLASEDTVRGKLGRFYQDTRGAEDDPAAPRQAWAEPEGRTVVRSALGTILGYAGAVTAGGLVFATGGAAAVAVAAGVVGAAASGGLGYTLGRVIDGKVAGTIQQQIEHGGVVVWVRVDNDAEAARASTILTQHGAADVHVHQLRSES